MPLTYAFRLVPGPQALDQAMLADKLGYERVWSPEVPAFGHDIWVHLARIAERTQRIGIGPAVLIPSYRHPVAQASAIATLEHMAPGRLMAVFGTGFTGRIALGQKPLPWEAMRRNLLQVRALLRGGGCGHRRTNTAIAAAVMPPPAHTRAPARRGRRRPTLRRHRRRGLECQAGVSFRLAHSFPPSRVRALRG